MLTCLGRRYSSLNIESLATKLMDAHQGISLTVDQYKALLKAIPAINASLKDAGVDVSGYAVDDEDESDSLVAPKKKTKPRNEKSNIDATSDEDE